MKLVVKNYRKLNKISGYCFGAGNFLAQCRHFMPPPLNILINIAGLFCILSGYTFWALAFLFHPLQTTNIKPCKWNNLIRNHNIASAIVGIVATILCIVFIANPVGLFAGLCLYIPSQVAWLTGEFHKLQKASENVRYSKVGQMASMSYAFCSTGLTVLMAATYATTLLLPASITMIAGIPALPFVLGVSALIGTMLLFIMVFSYIQSDIKANADLAVDNSYTDILTELNYTSELDNELKNSPEDILDKTCQPRSPWFIVRNFSQNTQNFIQNRQDDEENADCLNCQL